MLKEEEVVVVKRETRREAEATVWWIVHVIVKLNKEQPPNRDFKATTSQQEQLQSSPRACFTKTPLTHWSSVSRICSSKMDRETDLYFRRLTWIASKYYHQTAIGTNTALDPFANIPFGVPSSKNSSQTLRALQSFSNLLTRSAKVVVVASEGSRLSVMEEPAKEEQCLTGSIEETGETPRASAAMIKANAKGHGEGKFVISRNPRWYVLPHSSVLAKLT